MTRLARITYALLKLGSRKVCLSENSVRSVLNVPDGDIRLVRHVGSVYEEWLHLVYIFEHHQLTDDI
jgi:hypothetical protein